MEQKTDKASLKDLIAGIVLFAVIGALFILVVTYGVRVLLIKPNEQEVVEVLVKQPQCERTVEEYRTLVSNGQSITLLSNAISYAGQGERFVKSYDINLIRSGEGEVACGYLYAKVSKANQSIDEKFDSIYVNPQGLGGHLLRSRSIQIDDPADNFTEVLFPLASIPYLPNIPYRPEAQNFEIANWSKLLNVSQKTAFEVGLSTLSPSGVINELTIAYKCWNPETGEETMGCQLSVED